MAELFTPSLLGVSPDGKKLTFRAYIILAVLCLGFFLPGLAALPPTDRDESLFAQATKQMIETGDYVNINFLGTSRYKKPVGIYWLQSFSVRLLNPHHLDEIWAYRVPSVMGALVAVLMTAALGTLLFNGMAGFIAGIMLASCLDLNVEAHLAKTDAVLLATVVMAQYALACAYLIRPSGWKNAAIFWSAIGIGILIKGPVVLLPLFSTLLWLRISEKNLVWFSRLKPVFGIPYALLLVAPWFIAINLASHGQFTEASAGHDFIAKIWQGQDRGFLPPGLHALIFPAMFFPFSLFALLAIPDAWAARKDRAVKFCLGWIIPTWIVFELSLTKLPHYVLPAYPAFALLAAKFFLDGFPVLTNSTKRWWTTIMVSLWLLIGISLAFALSILPYIVDHTINPIQIICSGLLLLSQGAGLLFYLQRQKTTCIVMVSLGVMIFSGFAFANTVPNLKRFWVSREIVREARPYSPCAKFSIVAAGYEEPSLAFLAGTGTKLVPNGTFAASEMQHDLCRVGVINAPLLSAFLTSSQDFTTQPIPVGTAVEGVNIGRGSTTTLFFYVMPQIRAPDPVYP